MVSPQPGIFALNSQHFYFLEYNIRQDAPIEAVIASLETIYTKQEQSHVILAFGSALWRRFALRPEFSFEPFTSLYGPFNHVAIASQHDLLVWLHADNQSVLCDGLNYVMEQLGEYVDLKLECNGFTYKDDRDLTGFVDGSANPKTEQEKEQAALIQAPHDYAGGSFVLTQKWVHKLKKFDALSIPQQEKVIGRTKVDSIELEGDNMPQDSHVSRTDVSLNNTPLKIYRRSAPFANAHESGLYFMGFSCEQLRFEIQLQRMYGLTEDNIYDKLIDYSDAINSAYWFAPSETTLKTLFSTKKQI